MTLRETTERPIAVERGTIRLVGRDSACIRCAVRDVMAGAWPHARQIPVWDGHAASRIATPLIAWLGDHPRALSRSAPVSSGEQESQ